MTAPKTPDQRFEDASKSIARSVLTMHLRLLRLEGCQDPPVIAVGPDGWPRLDWPPQPPPLLDVAAAHRRLVAWDARQSVLRGRWPR